MHAAVVAHLGNKFILSSGTDSTHPQSFVVMRMQKRFMKAENDVGFLCCDRTTCSFDGAARRVHQCQT